MTWTQRFLMVCVILGLMVGNAFAKNATWTRNSEPDMKHYRVWLCQVKGCSVQRTGNTPYALVDQTPEGVNPFVVLPDGVEGQAAVDAGDQSGNYSGLSNKANFSTVQTDIHAPAVPLNFMIE